MARLRLTCALYACACAIFARLSNVTRSFLWLSRLGRREGAGKCLPGWVRVYDPDAGEAVAIEQFCPRETSAGARAMSRADSADVRVRMARNGC